MWNNIKAKVYLAALQLDGFMFLVKDNRGKTYQSTGYRGRKKALSRGGSDSNYGIAGIV